MRIEHRSICHVLKRGRKGQKKVHACTHAQRQLLRRANADLRRVVREHGTTWRAARVDATVRGLSATRVGVRQHPHASCRGRGCVCVCVCICGRVGRACWWPCAGRCATAAGCRADGCSFSWLTRAHGAQPAWATVGFDAVLAAVRVAAFLLSAERTTQVERRAVQRSRRLYGVCACVGLCLCMCAWV